MRDCKNDIISKKKTIVVKIGVKTAKIYHYILIILSFVCAVSYVLINFSKATQFIFLLAYIPLTIHSIYVYNNKEESKLDPELKKVAFSTFLFSILLLVQIVLLRGFASHTLFSSFFFLMHQLFLFFLPPLCVVLLFLLAAPSSNFCFFP